MVSRSQKRPGILCNVGRPIPTGLLCTGALMYQEKCLRFDITHLLVLFGETHAIASSTTALDPGIKVVTTSPTNKQH